MVWERVAIAVMGLALGGCVISIDETVSPKMKDMTVPVTTMHYEAEIPGGQTDPVHDLLPQNDPDRSAVLLYFRGEMVSYEATMMEILLGDGSSYESPVFLARDGGLLIRRAGRFYRVGSYAAAVGGPGPMTPDQALKVQWEGATFAAYRHHTLPQTLYTLKLTTSPRAVSSPDLLVPDCTLPPDRREPAGIYYVELTSTHQLADKPFNVKVFVDGEGRGYALMRLPVAESFKAEVDPVAHTITVTGDVSYPDASPEKGCAVAGGFGNYHTPVTLEVPVKAPAGTYTVRIPESHYRAGIQPDITKNYFSKSSRQEVTVTVE